MRADKGIICAGPIPFSIHRGMFSASADAAERKYCIAIGSDGRRWVYADQENSADNIYADGGVGSRGMGGRTLTFELIDGTKVDFIGPWKSNSNALFNETGVDLREKHLTQGIVGLKRVYSPKYGGPSNYFDVLHYDEAPVVGSFNRIDNIAKDLAAHHKCKVFWSSVAHGGGSESWTDAPK